MPVPLSLTSRLFDRVGRAVIGPPALQLMQHVYLLPADRIRQEPMRPDDAQWLHRCITVNQVSRQMLRRLGPLVSLAVCAWIISGLLALSAIAGVKAGLRKAEGAFSSSSAPALNLPQE